MTQPTRFLFRMCFFVALVAAVAALLRQTLTRAFLTNPFLDGLILFILVLGVLWNFRSVLRLQSEIGWVEGFRSNRPALLPPRPPRLLSPLARHFATHPAPGRGSLSFQASQAALDSLAGRLDETREISRYMTSLLIFLGLLGTFYGLLLTVDAIAGVIGGMNTGRGDLDVMFEQLKSGLSQPLRGMSTAFSGSMFGLAGALVLGFLDLVAGQAQNRFYNEVEEWLLSLTSQNSASHPPSAPAYVQSLLEQTAENLDALQKTIERQEKQRAQHLQTMNTVQEHLVGMSTFLSANAQALKRVAETQEPLYPLLKTLSDRSTSLQGTGTDPHETLAALHRIEHQMSRLVDESHQGRDMIRADIHNDLRLLARTIAATHQADTNGTD